MTRFSASLLCLVFLLSGCSSQSISEEVDSITARSGATAGDLLVRNTLRPESAARPTAPLGLFAATYLAQGVFIPVHAAFDGIESQRFLLESQESPTAGETFQLLQEFGGVLQIDFIDILNRSDDRRQTLDQYIETLQSTGNVATRKSRELAQQEEQLKGMLKEQQAEARQLKREINAALKIRDYNQLAVLQEESANAEATAAQTEVKLHQNQDIADRYDELLKIAEERLRAISVNREALIAGVRVVDVPGIEDLGILDTQKPFRRNSTQNDDIFGAGALDR
jgi:hypothetical protein